MIEKIIYKIQIYKNIIISMKNKISNNNIKTPFKFDAIPLREEKSKRTSGYEYISYGTDNLYPQYLYNVYHKSSTKHSSIINRKSSMTAGFGIDKTDLSDNQKFFLQNPFGNMDITNICKLVAYDLEVLYYYTLEVIYSNDLQTIASINYLPASKVRIGIATDDNPNKHFLYSNDWSNTRKDDNKIVYYEPYSAGLKGNKKELLYVPLMQGFTDNYPHVGYASALEYIEVDRQIAEYHNANLTNSFNGAFMINFKTGVPTEEEKRDFDRDFKREYTKSMNAGKYIVTYSDNGEDQPEIVPIPSDGNADKFNELEVSVLQNIMIAHETVDPELMGIMVPGSLGNSDNLASLKIFQALYIDVRQLLIQDALNVLYDYNTDQDFVGFKLNKFKIDNNEE